MSNTKPTDISLFITDSRKNDEYLLTKFDKDRLKKINSKKSAQEYITAHSLLNQVLIDKLQVKLPQLEFIINPHGKPFLSPTLFTASKLYFSLSHSQGVAAVALCTGSEIGLDIEDNSRKSPEACLKLARRFFSESENKYLDPAVNSTEELREKFFRLWTLKESFLKARGTGINTSLKEISFTILPSDIQLHTPHSGRKSPYTFYSHELQNLTLGITAATAGNCRLQCCRYTQEYGVYHENTIDFDYIS